MSDTKTFAELLDTAIEGIQKFINGDYSNPSSFRNNLETRGRCPHFRHSWDECCECNDEYFEALLTELKFGREEANNDC